MVDATLIKIFICRLRARKEVFGNAAAEVASIRARKEFVHQYGGISVHGKRRLTGDNALPRVVIGHGGQTGNPQMLAQSFVSCEKESLVLTDGTSYDAAKLVAPERRYWIRRPIEEILCIQRRVAMKFEHRAVKGVRARSSDGVDDSSRRAAKFGRVCIGQHLKLEDGLDPQQHASYRAGRLVIDVIDVRAIQEKIVVFGARTINGDLRRATAYDVTAGRQRRRNSGLQQCQLLKRAAVQWQVPDLLVVHQSAHRGGSCIDRGRLSQNIHLAGNVTRRKRHVNDEFLSNCQFDFLSKLFFKTVR